MNVQHPIAAVPNNLCGALNTVSATTGEVHVPAEASNGPNAILNFRTPALNVQKKSGTS